MLQLLFHVWGDYLFQSGWMANNKTKPTLKGWVACLVHCFIYSLPFAFITSFYGWLSIFTTHVFIDHYRLASVYIRFREGTKTKTGYPEDTPIWLSTILMFIVDNSIHVTINYFSIKYL